MYIIFDNFTTARQTIRFLYSSLPPPLTITSHRYKKIHCIVVRGAHFCPSALDCLSEHLGVTKNNMIMGECVLLREMCSCAIASVPVAKQHVSPFYLISIKQFITNVLHSRCS